MNETKKKWIDKEWSKLIVGAIFSLIVGVILIIITIIITPLPVGNILAGYLNSLRRLINNILLYKFAVWELMLAAISGYCFTLAKNQIESNKPKQGEVAEIVMVPTELGEPSAPKATPTVQLPTSIRKGDNGFVETKISKMLDYTADRFDNLVYKWKWKKHPLTKLYEVIGMSPVCETEDCKFNRLTYIDSSFISTFYKCGKCNRKYETSYSNDDIKTLVENKFPRATKHIMN